MANPERFLLAGVMGWPVMHSRSPKLHNFWFEKYGLAGSYVPLAVKPDGLRTALRALPSLCFSGCNLTIPHKQAAMAIVDENDLIARKIGAISCVVVRPDGSLLGSNNDCYGFIHNIVQEFPDWRADAGPTVVIGAGVNPEITLARGAGLALDGERGGVLCDGNLHTSAPAVWSAGS